MSKLTRYFLIVFLLLPLLSCKSKVEYGYLFTYFMGRGESGLHLAYSYDGLKWDSLFGGVSVLKPVLGDELLMRDPSMVRDDDGTFHLVWTTGWWEQGFGYAYSKDLLTWSEPRFIPVMEKFPGAKNTWAPELFYHEATGLYYIIWASTVPGKFPEIETTPNEIGLNHRQYYVTTRDFITFSETALFYDPGFSVIDGTIVKKDSLYWFIIKNEMSVPSEKNLRVTFTDNLPNGFPDSVSGNISGELWAEGPSPLVIGDYVHVYFDKYRNRRYGAIRSSDGQNWEDISHLVSFPRGTRHGTAIKVPKRFIERLKTQQPLTVESVTN